METMKSSKFEKFLLVFLFLSFFFAVIADFYHCGIKHTESKPANNQSGTKTGYSVSENLSDDTDDKVKNFHFFVTLSLLSLGSCTGWYLCKVYYTSKAKKIQNNVEKI